MAARWVGIGFGLVAVVMLQCAAAQTLHVVGDSMGWGVPQGGGDYYANWAAGKTFVVGDTLLFNFRTNEHDVVRLPRASFDECSYTNTIGDIITTGPVNITLEASGEHYYICTIGRHCLGGQKLAINVSTTPGAPTVSPPSTTPPPPSTPSNTPPAAAADCPSPSSSTAPTTPLPQGGAGATPPPPPNSSSMVLASAFVSLIASVTALLF